MAFLVIHKGEAPLSKALAALLARWRRELDAAGTLGLALDFALIAQAARLHLGAGGERVEHGPFADGSAQLAGFTVVAAASKAAALAGLERLLAASDVDGAVFEARATGCPGGCATVAAAAPGDGSRWVVLLRSTAGTERDEVQAQARLDALNAFNAAQAAAGVLLAGDGLTSSARGARLMLQAGRTAIIDGPFAEAKELIAGFWMVRAPTIDAALDWARRLPYPTGPEVEVEIREVLAPAAASALAPDQARAENGLRAEALDAGLRAELAARPAWR